MKLKTVVAAMLMALAAVVIASGCKQTVTVPEAKDKTPPKEVTNLKAVTGDGKISLSWTNPIDADLHQVEITASPAAGSLTNPVYLSAEKGKAMSFTAEGLSNGTAYTFTVKTIDKALNKSTGVKTETAVAPIDTSDKTPPAEVTTLKGDAGNGKVLLSWKNPGDEDLYQVEISASPAVGTLTNPVYLSAAKGSAGSFMAEGLTGGQEYTFTVKTIDKTLNVGTAVTVKATPQGSGGGSGSSTADTTAPAEVTELTAIAGNGKVSLRWKNPGDADLYQVEVSASPAAGSLTNPVYLSAVKGAAGSFMAEGLTGGQEYTFTVKTIDKTLNVGTAVTVKATPESSGGGSTIDTTAPAEVTNLQAEALAGAIRLTWSDPTDADLWGIEITSQQKIVTRSIAPIPENAIFVAKGQQSRKISNLTVGQSYTFTIKTIDNSGNKSAGTSTTTVTPKAGEPMTLTPEQNPAKETWTKDSVTITVKSNTSIKKAKWKEGSGHSAKDVLENGNSITGNSFTVSENGIYSVAVQDNDGRREVEKIEIKNIDKDPPPVPTNLTAEYRFGEKKIILKWSDPVDTASGLKELKLSYTVNGANEKTETIAKGVQTLEIANVEPKDPLEPYAFSLKAVDNAGNEGATASITITPSAQAEVTGISLNRTHLDTLMSNRDIKVTITGSNFDKLTSLLVQVTDGSISQPPVPAAIEASNNKATVTVQAPTPTSPTDEGTRYTVKAIVNSATPAAATASFIVSAPAKVSNIALTPDKLKLGSATKVSVAVTGTNFDICGATKIKLLDLKGDEVSGSTVTVPANKGTATEFSAEITLPNADGIYTVAVYFDEVKERKTSILQLYGAPEITSVNIPKAGKTYGGSKLSVTITGKNFTAPGISAASFSGTPALSDIKIVGDTLVTAKADCPYTAGETNLTVTCTPTEGAPVQRAGKIIVTDYLGYDVGKIVLANKALVKVSDYSTIDPTNPPVGIICGDLYGAPRMVALHRSGKGLPWAKSRSTGCNTKFEGIICQPSETGHNAYFRATFDGDTDGSDNWEYICSIDLEGTKDDDAVKENYPAFHWVNQYNTQYASLLGGKTFDWYMPSFAELCQVYKNIGTINMSLKKICDMQGSSTYASEFLRPDWAIFSSSQSSEHNEYVWVLNCRYDKVEDNFKGYQYDVCCIAGF